MKNSKKCDYYVKTRKLLVDAIKSYHPSTYNSGLNIECIQKGIHSLDSLFNNGLAVHSVESRNNVFVAIDSFIDNNKSLNSKQKEYYRAVYKKKLEENTNSFLFDVPQLTKETVKQLEDRFKSIFEKDYPEEIKQQMMGLYNTLSHALNLHKYSKIKNPRGSFGSVLSSDIMGGGGYFNHKLTLEYGPELVKLIADVIATFPELFDNRFSKLIICRFFIGQFSSMLATGITQKQALATLLSEINKSDPSLCKCFKDLVKEINTIEKECLVVHPKGNGMSDNNELGFFQLEFVHAYCNLEEKVIFNFDDPSLRKTSTTLLAMIVRLKREGYKEDSILVEAPTNLRTNWMKEIKDRFNLDLINVVDIHREVLKEKNPPKCPKGKFQVELVGNNVHSYEKNPLGKYLGCIVDEIHNDKQRENGKNSKRSKHMMEYVQNIPYRIGATGTPLVNELTEFMFIVNAFSGKQIIPEDSIKCAIGAIEMAYLMQLHASPFVIRRREMDIFDIPQKNLMIEEVVLGKKELNIREKMKSTSSNSLADIARFEAIYKIPCINIMIMKFPNRKGVVFSGWVNQSDRLKDVTGNTDGVLYQAFKKCPIGRPKIYIAGNKIVDINGVTKTYNLDNAELARKQFEKSKGDVVAYVSLQTSREGINEFGKGVFVSYLTLPFECASLNQSGKRICRGTKEVQNIHIPSVKYLSRSKKVFHYRNKKIIKSFDEQCLKRIMIKEQLSNVICDAVKRDFATGEIDEWDVSLDDFDSVMYIDLTPPNTTVNNGAYVACCMGELAGTSPSLISDKIDKMNNEERNIDMFDVVESFGTAKESLQLIGKQIGSIRLQSKEKVSFAHVGGGKGVINQTAQSNCKKISRFDLWCKGEGIVNCDRSEINNPEIEGYCEDGSVDLLAATNMLHWQLDSKNVSREMVINLSDTLIAFNKSLKVGGLCLITCPLDKYDYPFARHKGMLSRYGFELVENKGLKKVRCYLLRKKRDFGKDVDEKVLVRLSKLLPKQIKGVI